MSTGRGKLPPKSRIFRFPVRQSHWCCSNLVHSVASKVRGVVSTPPTRNAVSWCETHFCSVTRGLPFWPILGSCKRDTEQTEFVFTADIGPCREFCSGNLFYSQRKSPLGSDIFECPHKWVWSQVPLGGTSPSSPLRPETPHASLGRPLREHREKIQGGWGGQEGG